MKNLLIISLIIIGYINIFFAQIPQIALVKPDGTTTVYTTFDAAYNDAADDDYIYMPGGTFSLTNPIMKRLHIYGAGAIQDSCNLTGITILNNLI